MFLRRSVRLVMLLVSIVAIACGKSESPAGSTSSTSAAPSAASAGAKPPFGFLSTPAEGEVVKLDPTKPWFATGWALADSGVADVSVKFDDGQVGYVKTGFPFPGVKEQYPTYADSDKAGYMFGIPKLPAGKHSVSVTVTARDGTTAKIERHFTIP